MKLRQNLLAAAMLAIGVAGCQNSAYINADNSAKEDSEKMASDVHAAVSTFAEIRVDNTGAGGVPTSISGKLGKLDQLPGMAPARDAGLRESMERIAPIFRLSTNDLVVTRTDTDSLGFKHVRYAQTKNSLPVVGGDLIVHVDREGTIYAVNGHARDGVSLGTQAKVLSSAALESAKRHDASVAQVAADNARLVYLLANDKTGAMSLAWEVTVTGERAGIPVRDLVYVNAQTGAVSEVHPQVYTALNREVHNLNHGTSLPGPTARTEGQGAIGENDVDTNYARLGDVWNYYKTKFNRDSFDGAGAKLISSVHYSNNYVNAYWNSTQMVYGDGDGVNATSLAISMDVTAHELTHAVTERTANLTYSGESGGLNEAMSDSLGNAAEALRDGGGTTSSVSANTWKVGEDIWTPGTAGDALRYMNDPKLDGVSLDYYSDYSGQDVHYSSGISNLAFYLVSQGGTHPRGRSSVVVTGVGINHAEQIWYRALTVYMTASETFADAKTHTKQAATDLYGAGSADVTAVDNAWTCVGVGIPPPPPTPLSNGVPVTGISASSGNKYYSLVVPAGQTSLTFTISGGTGDADLYVKFGTAPTSSSYDCRPYVSGNSETCTFSNPAAGTWYVMLNAYSAYSGVTLTGTYGTVVDNTPALTNGVPVTGISGASGSQQYWKLTVPSGQAKVVFTITPGSGSTGDADLYVKRGAKPTTTTYDCRPYLSGNTETCTITSPVAGDYYVMIRGYTAFTAVTLKGQYP